MLQMFKKAYYANHLSVPIEEDVYITMQEAMLIELRVTTNNPSATDQPSWQALPLYTHCY